MPAQGAESRAWRMTGGGWEPTAQPPPEPCDAWHQHLSLTGLELAAVSGGPDRTTHDAVTRLERQGLAAPLRHATDPMASTRRLYVTDVGLRLPFVNLQSGALPTFTRSPVFALCQSLQRRAVRPKWNQPWNQSACSKRPVGRRFPPVTPGSRPRLPFCNRTRIPVHAHDITKPVRESLPPPADDGGGFAHVRRLPATSDAGACHISPHVVQAKSCR